MPREFEPVRIKSGTGEKIAEVPLFYIDDVEYTIPERIPAALTVRLIDQLADGQDEAHVISRTIRDDILGRDAMKALRNSPDVTNEQVEQILDIVGDMLVGALESSVGKSRPTPRR
jgi:hypothetical protein